MEQFYEISGIVSLIILTFALIIAITKYNYFKENEKWYVYYIIFICLIESISYTISFFEIIGGKPLLYPFYIAGEFFVVTGIFIKKINLSNYYFILTGMLSLFFLIADKILLGYDSDYSKAISNMLIIITVGYALLQEIKKGNGKDHFIIIDKMFFLYFSVSIFIFLFQHKLLTFPVEYYSGFWIINNLMICVVYSLFIKTFLQLKK